MSEKIYSLLEAQALADDNTIENLQIDLDNYMAYFIDLKESSTENFEFEVNNFWNTDIAINNSPHLKKAISWFDGNDMDLVQEEVRRIRNKTLSAPYNFKPRLEITDWSIFDVLHEQFPNMREVTDYYKGAFLLNQSRENYQAPNPILLLGNPGIGKTHYAKKLAKLLNTTHKFIDAGAISASWVLAGGHKSWKDGKVGLVFNTMLSSNTISPVILIDEIDKLSPGKNYDPNSTFHQMFEKTNAKEFYDEAIDMAFDASHIIYILTANNVYDIAPSLLSRFNVFHIENPDKESMKKIIPTIYDEVLEGSHLFEPQLDMEEINKLVLFAPREVKQSITKSMFTQASRMKEAPTEPQKLIVQVNPIHDKKIGFN
jgi:ATP-dependent Lon protease